MPHRMNTLGRGILAGFVGTGVMTGVQLAVRWARDQPLGTPVPRTWADAPAPAQAAKKAADAVGEGRRITKKDVPLVTNVLHWAYGISWGVAYAAAARAVAPSPVAGGAAFGTGVWLAAYAELVPLGIYEAPWKYPPQEVALDLGYHLAYGIAVGAAFAALDD
jgi:uncharacterized membrane protein YagU involved in acid resistance